MFLMIQAFLGLSIVGAEGRVVVNRPRLPGFVDSLDIDNLRVGEGTLDLKIWRRGRDVEVDVARKEGELDVLVVK